jgi:hypothetical protein
VSTTPPEPPTEPTPPTAPTPTVEPTTPAYAPATAAPAYAPAGPTPPAGPGGNFRSSRGKTIGLIVAGVVAVGALGGLGALLFGGDDGDKLTSPGKAGGQPSAEVSPSTDGGGILDPTPVGSASPDPGATDAASPSPEATDGPTLPSIPTEEPSPTLDPTTDGTDVVTIGSGVQVPVLPGWDVVGQGDSDVLLGDGQNSYVYAVTGVVDPSSDAASVISASMDSILPKQSYTQLRKTDITPLEAFGSVVSIAGLQYQATWTDQQASVPLQGLLICAVRQDGTAIIMTAEHAPPDEFESSAESWAPVLNATLGLFGSS